MRDEPQPGLSTTSIGNACTQTCRFAASSTPATAGRCPSSGWPITHRHRWRRRPIPGKPTTAPTSHVRSRSSACRIAGRSRTRSTRVKGIDFQLVSSFRLLCRFGVMGIGKCPINPPTRAIGVLFEASEELQAAVSRHYVSRSRPPAFNTLSEIIRAHSHICWASSRVRIAVEWV